jgi:hypothetical protein
LREQARNERFADSALFAADEMNSGHDSAIAPGRPPGPAVS